MSYLKYNVIPTNAFEIKRKCSGCGCEMTYQSTHFFRVNANGSHIDVWMIYQCSKCKHTFNLPIHERVNPRDINSMEYKKFLENDKDLAFQYETDLSLMKQNNLVMDWTNLTYEIVNKHKPDTDTISKIEIKNSYGLKLRTEKVLSEILNKTRGEIEEMVQRKEIIISSKNLKRVTVVELNYS